MASYGSAPSINYWSLYADESSLWWIKMGLRLLTTALLLLLLIGPASAQNTHIWMEGRPECSGSEAPRGIRVVVFVDGSDVLGYIELGWWDGNLQIKPNENIILDVVPESPRKLVGGKMSISRIASNENTDIDAEISGVVGRSVHVTVSSPMWDCTPTRLKVNASGRGFNTFEGAELVRRARNVGSVAQIADGPSQTEVKDQMTSAAAFQLCNPTDPEMAAQITALNATGLYVFRAEGAACVGYMLGFPIGSLGFSQESYSCDVNTTTKVASCVSEMALRCETRTDANLSGNFCSSVLSANFAFTGKANFELDSVSGSWVAGSVSVVGKER